MKEKEFSAELKSRLLEILHFTLDFCNKNNLRCYGCGGTVLGAVRHKGFIPWDDDIDLYMPREDYNKLVDMNEKLSLSGYSFKCFENDKEYYLPFGKIIDNNSTLWELKRFPYLVGVYIDIFPLDCFDVEDESIERERKEYCNLYAKYQMTLEDLDFSSLYNRFIHFRSGKLVDTLRFSGNKRKKDALYDELLDKTRKYKNQRGEKCVCVTQWFDRIFFTSWFKNSKQLPFEDTFIQVPGNYDAYLKLLYGDYMKLPPIEERTATHGDVRYYTNLKEKLSIEEVKERIHKGETLIF